VRKAIQISKVCILTMAKPDWRTSMQAFENNFVS